MARRLREWAAGEDESLGGGFVLQFRRPENRGVDLETGVPQTTGNLFQAVPVAGERQVCALRICSVYRSTLRLKTKK